MRRRGGAGRHPPGDLLSKRRLLHFLLDAGLDGLLEAGLFGDEPLLVLEVQAQHLEGGGARDRLAHHELQEGHLELEVVAVRHPLHAHVHHFPGKQADELPDDPAQKGVVIPHQPPVVRLEKSQGHRGRLERERSAVKFHGGPRGVQQRLHPLFQKIAGRQLLGVAAEGLILQGEGEDVPAGRVASPHAEHVVHLGHEVAAVLHQKRIEELPLSRGTPGPGRRSDDAEGNDVVHGDRLVVASRDLDVPNVAPTGQDAADAPAPIVQPAQREFLHVEDGVLAETEESIPFDGFQHLDGAPL